MRLASFTVKNYRSITDAYKLPLRDFAVLVGPNNEGKSNILRGIVTALRIISTGEVYRTRQAAVRYRYGMDDEGFRYAWERDFPVALREALPDGRSEFTLEFELDEDERHAFTLQVKSNLATNLKLRLALGKDDARLDVMIQGKGKKYLTQRVLEIARFVAERIEIQYIPAIRPTDLTIGVVDDMLARRLRVLEQDPNYRRLLNDLAEAQRPVLDALGMELTKTVASFIPEVKKITLESESDLRRAIRRSCNVMVDDGTETPLAMKGDGVKSLTAISLMRHVGQKAQGSRGLILAIEEPESHLHPRAVHRLREVLQEIATSHQVIVTTHSPVLVDRADAGRNIIVEGGHAGPAATLRQVRAALGVEVADNLSSAQLVLLVEGEHDVKIIGGWIAALSQTVKAALNSGNLVIDHLAGASNLRYKVGVYKSLLCNIHVFLDNDEAGRKAVDGALEARVLESSEYAQTVCKGMPNSEIEDLLVESSYSEALQQQYGVALNPKFMSSSKDPWAERIGENFQDQGKPWSKVLERQVKEVVAGAAAAGGLASLNEHRRGSIDALVSTIEQRLTQV